MSVGSTLINLQDTDLELERTRDQLANLPLIAELAKKRASHTKLKAESTRLLAMRKDAEIAVSDLDDAKRAYEEADAAARNRPLDPSDYRAVRDLDEELSLIAKRLDKISYDRPAKVEALQQAIDRETKVNAYIQRFEASIIEDTKEARSQAAALQATVDELTRRREHLLSKLPQKIQDAYLRGLKRFKGLAVERIEGNVPTVCRTALQPASMDRLRHVEDVAECPYCHRLLVVHEEE